MGLLYQVETARFGACNETFAYFWWRVNPTGNIHCGFRCNSAASAGSIVGRWYGQLRSAKKCGRAVEQFVMRRCEMEEIGENDYVKSSRRVLSAVHVKHSHHGCIVQKSVSGCGRTATGWDRFPMRILQQ
jgi:hypothetical protein